MEIYTYHIQQVAFCFLRLNQIKSCNHNIIFSGKQQVVWRKEKYTNCFLKLILANLSITFYSLHIVEKKDDLPKYMTFWSPLESCNIFSIKCTLFSQVILHSYLYNYIFVNKICKFCFSYTLTAVLPHLKEHSHANLYIVSTVYLYLE